MDLEMGELAPFYTSNPFLELASRFHYFSYIKLKTQVRLIRKKRSFLLSTLSRVLCTAGKLRWFHLLRGQSAESPLQPRGFSSVLPVQHLDSRKWCSPCKKRSYSTKHWELSIPPSPRFLGFLMDNMIFSELEDLKDFGGHVFKVCPMMETVSCSIE